jgi:hypothetical protein
MKTALSHVPDPEPDPGSVSFWASLIRTRNIGTILTRAVFGPAEALLLSGPDALKLIEAWVYLNLHPSILVAIQTANWASQQEERIG